MEPGRSGEGDLQFDTVEAAASEAPPPLGCARCKKAIATTYYEVDSQVTCDACHRELGTRWRRGTPGKLLRAVVFGVGAAIAGGVAYGVVSAVTGYHLALISIGVGILVGYAVRHATAGKGGRGYQLIAAVLTYLAIAGSYVPEVAQGILAGAGESAETSAGAAGGSVAPTATPASGAPAGTSAPSASPASAPAEAPKPSLGEALVGLVIFGIVVIVLALAAPILILVDSFGSDVLEILIVGFGVWRAWRMNAAAVPVVSGPFSATGALAAAAQPIASAPASSADVPRPVEDVGDR